MATLDTVKEVLESNLDIDPENVTEDATFEDLGIDSLDELPPLAPYLPRVEALGEIVEQADEMAGRRTP